MANIFANIGKAASGIGQFTGDVVGGVGDYLAHGTKTYQKTKKYEDQQRKLSILNRQLQNVDNPRARDALLLKYFRENESDVMAMMKSGGGAGTPLFSGAAKKQPSTFDLLDEIQDIDARATAGKLDPQTAKNMKHSLISRHGEVLGGPYDIMALPEKAAAKKTKRQQLLDEGFTEKEADRAVRIAAKLIPGTARPDSVGAFDFLDEIQDIDERVAAGKLVPQVAKNMKSSLISQYGEALGGPYDIMPSPEGAIAKTKKTKKEQWLDEGFTEDEANKAVKIAARLEPGAAQTGSAVEEMTRWGNVRKNALDPVWGKVTDQKTYDFATKQIRSLQNRVLAEQQGQATTETVPSPTDYKPATLNEGQLMSKISKINIDGKLVGPRRAGEIVRSYPRLSKLLVTMKLAEAKEIIGAIADGMTEEEIMRFINKG